jgi:hypothetical protein
MKPKKQRPADGEIRQSQILSTFGPGSMVDLPDASVLIGGLNCWKFNPAGRREIIEDRLARKIYERFKLRYPELTTVKLYEPPENSQDSDGVTTGITAFTFPAWFVAQTEDEESKWKSPSGKVYRSRPLIKYNVLERGKRYLDENHVKCPVVPVRFVQACPNGHISDIDWPSFVQHKDSCKNWNKLRLDEGEASNDFADIFVRCVTCEARRPLSDATIQDPILKNSIALGRCQGKLPWLGPNDHETCVDPNPERQGKPYYNRLLVRSSSSAYSAKTQNVISLPDSNQKLRDAVNQVYDSVLQIADTLSMLQLLRKTPLAAGVLKGFSDEAVWQEVQRRRKGISSDDKTIKQVEIETLLCQASEIGENVPDSDFYATSRSLDNIPQFLQDKIDRIVLVHRLREVVAQIGFTRFESLMADIDGELDVDVKSAPIDREPSWFPAIENKGEGVFISFSKSAVEEWSKRPAVQARGKELLEGFDIWAKRRGIDLTKVKVKFPGVAYVLMHSLSHLLITAVSLECGYSASAIRERIYAGDYGYGILLYTGSSGSEGTLGGLVEVGNRIESLLASAIELGKLCSNDPVCAQHKPAATYEERFLHGAACHGCLLIAETSCEQNNEFLDRALVVDTVEYAGAAFFSELA